MSASAPVLDAPVVVELLLGAPLLTADGPLARSPGHRAQVELVTHV